MAPPSPMSREIRKAFEQADFAVTEVADEPATLQAAKPPCVCFLAREASGAWTLSGPPFYLVKGVPCRLEDRGYQKFWSGGGKRFPVRRVDLAALHRFEEEVRALLGLQSLYHQSLGTTCARSAYDRLDGRPDK